MNERTLRLVVVLGIICAVAAVALAGVSGLTKDPIEQQLKKEMREAAAVVAPEHDEVVDGLTTPDGEPLFLFRKSGAIVGYGYRIRTQQGYSGEIAAMLGATSEGAMTGLHILQHAETPGLGAKITSREILDRFIWKDAPGGTHRDLANTAWKVRKDGGDIDQITGATITTRAVVGAVSSGLQRLPAIRDVAASAAPDPAPDPQPADPLDIDPAIVEKFGLDEDDAAPTPAAEVAPDAPDATPAPAGGESE